MSSNGKTVCVTGASGFIASWLVKLLLNQGYTVKASVRDPERTTEKKSRMSPNGKTVCVTGASGFVASWLVKLLLNQGYTVKASVRDPADPKRTEHLRMLDGAKERLQLYKAELLEEGSFDVVVDGCEGVFHTATPVFFTAKDPQAGLIEPAVKGTLNVLGACSRTPTVKRVIITSSISACEHNTTSLTSDVVVDESWFSCPKFCRENKHGFLQTPSQIDFQQDK